MLDRKGRLAWRHRDVCNEFRLPYFACRGNNSESEQYKAGKRFEAHLANGLTPVVLHLGDHDPNGLDMTRDNRDRLAMFARQGVEVRRLALNMDQIERYRPPPNPAKETDTRYAAYAKQFGRECWELDALVPTVIANLIPTEVGKLYRRRRRTKAKERRPIEACLETTSEKLGEGRKPPKRRAECVRHRLTHRLFHPNMRRPMAPEIVALATRIPVARQREDGRHRCQFRLAMMASGQATHHAVNRLTRGKRVMVARVAQRSDSPL